MQFGEWIKQEREKLGLSQPRFGILCNGAYDAQKICRIEKGRIKKYDSEMINNLAKGLNRRPGELYDVLNGRQIKDQYTASNVLRH